ncbi:MAG: caspase family protein [Calothrix sp. MO_167.B42]|nr:caspase family protein [Calothrix sp. MO_167.B42]
MSQYNFHRNFAVIIGINNYLNSNYVLETAEPDARKLAEIMQGQHHVLKPQDDSQNGYEVKLLLNEDASLSQLKQLIADLKQGQISLDRGKVAVTASDRLLFYFAGHGIALDAWENKNGPAGYLIPQDATDGDKSTYLEIQELHHALKKLPCKHVLAILDCCFVGAFRWGNIKREAVRKVKIYQERYDRLIRNSAWQIITSVAENQTGLDSGKSSGRGKNGQENHSPFAQALFDALGRKADDFDQDGIFTATELYSYLRNQLEIGTEKHCQRQTYSLSLLGKHDKGEFIFLLPDFDRDNVENAPPLNRENNPYKGLQSYDEKDSHLFFGRTEQIKQLYQKVVANKYPLTIVLGASGTGKSSLMKAGLLPRLRKFQELHFQNHFQILDTMRPGESPLKALAQVCLPIANTITVSELAKDKQALANIIECWIEKNPKTKVLLTVDQFEELITLCKSNAERKQFEELIKNAITKYPSHIHVVITLGIELETQLQISALKDLWGDHTRFVVPPMTKDELREVIEKPALAEVLHFDPPSLVDELINEVAQMPGALPWLSFTLSELYLKCVYEQRENRVLTKEDYEDLGKALGSINKRANQEYHKLVEEDPAYENIVRRIVLRMISSQNGKLSRRQVAVSELVYATAEKNNQVQTVIKRFSDALLMVEGSNSQNQPCVELAHDALVHGWDKLLQWNNKEQEALILQRRLTSAANNWHKNDQGKDFLWDRDSHFVQLEQVFSLQSSQLHQLEPYFIHSSMRKTDEEYIQEKKQTIKILYKRAEAFLTCERQLDAFFEAVKAGKELNQLQRKYSWQDAELSAQLGLIMQKVVYRVKERDRLQKAQMAAKMRSLDMRVFACGMQMANIALNLEEGKVR